PLGKARTIRSGEDLTIVTWSSPTPLCRQAADALEEAGFSTEVIDLRSVSPWDKQSVIGSARKTGKLLVVHDDNHTCGMGGEICATVAEAEPSVVVARVARADTFIPYDFPSQLEVLPTYKTVLARAAEMLDLELEWEAPIRTEAGIAEIMAIGSGPSDESITIDSIHVKEGDKVDADTILVTVETDKATMEISTPVTGVVESLLVAETETIAINTPIARIRTDETQDSKSIVVDDPGRPIFKTVFRRRPYVAPAHATALSGEVILSSTSSVLGSRVVTNDDIVGKIPGWDSDKVIRRTGIESRFWVGDKETALSLGVDACQKLLEREGLKISDIDVLICSTGTPLQMTPSLACQVLMELSPSGKETYVQAYDVNAACSGYLYALQCAHDHLMISPNLRIIVLTSETLSPMLNEKDPGTYFLFGDAATATLLTSEPRDGNVNARVLRPVLSAKGEAPEILSVPFSGTGKYVEMDGPAVFRVAVRRLSDMIGVACADAELEIDDIDVIVPHQANRRILNAVCRQLKIPEDRLFINMRNLGNTSSNSIPLCLEEVAADLTPGQKVGMVAFGGGFTFGASLIEML
ncbi:MAG: beta-ketoacyl-ACP synthase 3, partial [Alphaproteobacteria bacterium]